VSVHIRRGDKHLEMKIIEDERIFFETAQVLWDRLKNDTGSAVRGDAFPVMFIGSEDAGAIDNAIAWGKERSWEVKYTNLFDRREVSTGLTNEQQQESRKNNAFKHHDMEYFNMILTLDGHGLADDDPITFRAEAGGTLPSPLVAGTTYYAIALTDSTFQVAATLGGSAVNLTTTGSNTVLVVQPPWTRWIEEESAIIECSCPSHVVPFDVVPPIVTRLTSLLVASRALSWAGKSDETVQAQLDRAEKIFDGWKKGQAIRGSVEPASAQVPQLWTGSTTESTRTIP
jgi:hypothetical protein